MKQYCRLYREFINQITKIDDLGGNHEDKALIFDKLQHAN